MIHTRVRVRGRPRCACCHGSLGAVRVTCSGCATTLHLECVPERCPTLGCGEGFEHIRERVAALGPRRDCVPAGPVERCTSLADLLPDLRVKARVRPLFWSLLCSVVLLMWTVRSRPERPAFLLLQLTGANLCGSLQR